MADPYTKSASNCGSQGFGMPSIGGISTEAIAGELDGGASLEEVAEDFGLDLDAVRWAQSYELSQHAAA